MEVFELTQKGQHERAWEMQLQLVKASKGIMSEGIPGLKYAMDLRGYHGGEPRAPLLPLSEQQKERIAGIISWLHPAERRESVVGSR